MTCLLCQQAIQLDTSLLDLILQTAPQPGACSTCIQSFSFISDQHCPSCFKSGYSQQCPDCIKWEAQGLKVNHQALLNYTDFAHDFFMLYKFKGHYQLRYVLAQLLTVKFRRPVVPIPLGPSRYQTRGFNQVSAILDAAGKSYLPLLLKDDSSQMSLKNRSDRLASSNPFSLNHKVPLPKKCLIIDDIYTTGRTLMHATELLQVAGVQDIQTFSFFR